MLEARLLESLVPLGSLSALHRQRLADRATLREHAAGETFTNEAEPAGQRLYLLSGSVIVEDGCGMQRRIAAGSEEARQPLADDHAGLLRLRCLEACRFIVLDAALCDALLTWDQGHPRAPSRRRDDDDWMSRLLVLPLFRQLPPQHLFELMRRFERVTALPGQRIIEQNTSGDYFYLLIAGRCSVQRANPDGRLAVLAELVDGACFGDEALISDEPRNASVTVLEASTLLRLSRHDFQVLLREPLLRALSATEAESRVTRDGARWLDVRLPAEHRLAHPPGSLNLPLHTLRQKRSMLARGCAYITACDTGRRSAVAAWLLRERGFEAFSLAGGWPPRR